MKRILSFKDLQVWQVSSDLAKDVTGKVVPILPREERFRLGDQIIRSSRAVPSQIAEGFRKSSLKEKHHYYEIAITSNDETENHLEEIRHNGFVDDLVWRHYANRVIKVRILLSRLMKSVRRMRSEKGSHGTVPRNLRGSQNRCAATKTAQQEPKPL